LMLARLHAATPALQAIATLLGAEDAQLDAVTAMLPHDGLVLMDNMEHLAEAATTVAALQAARPDLRLVITSRQALGLSGETVLTLAPVPLPAACTIFEQAAERAGATVPEADERQVVEQICARLDRLPLPIELAAARATVLGTQDILHQLSRPVRVLRRAASSPGDHHAAITTTIDWSVRLLPADAARLLRTIAAYPAPWPLSLLAEVHDSAELLDSLQHLAAAHLMVVEADGAANRYSLLQTVHDVLNEQLRAGGEEPSIRERHAAALLRTGTADAVALLGDGQQQALAGFDALSQHYDMAVDHLIEARDPRAVELAAALWRYWQLRGRFGYGLAVLQRSLRSVDGDTRPVVATARYGAAVLAHLAGTNDVAVELARAALENYQANGDAHGTGSVLSLLGMVSLHTGDPAGALDWYERGLREVTWQAAPRAYATLLANVGPVYAAIGDLARAIKTVEEAVVRYRMLRDAHAVALSLGNLARWSADTGDPERSRDLLNEALLTFEQVGDVAALAMVRLTYAEIALDIGDVAAARAEIAEARRVIPEDDPWNTAAADAQEAEALLLSGEARRATQAAAIALARGESLGYRVALVRARLVLAAAAAGRGDPAALQECRAGLAACEDGDIRAIVSFAALAAGLRPALAASVRQAGIATDGALVARPAAVVQQTLAGLGRAGLAGLDLSVEGASGRLRSTVLGSSSGVSR